MRLGIGADATGPFASLSRKGQVVAARSGVPLDDLLKMIDGLLIEAGGTSDDLKEIAVDRGPGGFSVVRRRVAVATALAHALSAKVAGVGHLTAAAMARLPSSRFKRAAHIKLLYDGAPNITKSKKVWMKPAKR